ncbi:hypothetical protein [Paraburkholderia sp. LEh10]|uniref:hypothetical protein n=1 Tax=Paraburkholderia sp. LEh10 TaxID=2821353 RepID=UPI0039185312
MYDIESMKRDGLVFDVPEAFSTRATIAGMEAYNALCAEAEKDYEGFWARLARENLLWSRPRSCGDCYARWLKAKQSPRMSRLWKIPLFWGNWVRRSSVDVY